VTVSLNLVLQWSIDRIQAQERKKIHSVNVLLVEQEQALLDLRMKKLRMRY
jgi:hypothetical protein